MAIPLIFFNTYLYICILKCVWKSKEILQDSVPSFYLMGSMDQAQVIRFGCKHIYLLTESFLWPIYLYVVTKKVFLLLFSRGMANMEVLLFINESC